MEMKEFYIAPEVEILCFQPLENLAGDDFMSGWNFTGGSGEAGGNQGEWESATGTGDGEEAEEP